MNDKSNIKEKIEKILLKHPEGLSILEISDFVGVHRHTVTKYIYELVGTGIIYQRDLGTVKLHYLPSPYFAPGKRRAILEKIKRQIK